MPNSTAVDTDVLLMRITYFAAEQPDIEEALMRGSGLDPGVRPSLGDCAAALLQAERYMYAAEDLATWPPRAGEIPSTARPREELPRPVAIHLGSPFVLLIPLTVAALGRYGPQLLLLGERISTSRPRIQRQRKEELLRQDVLDHTRRALEEGRADVLAFILLSEGPWQHRRGPSRIDFLDPDDPDDDDSLEPA